MASDGSFVELPGLHDDRKIVGLRKNGNIGQRIALYNQQIRNGTFTNTANLAFLVEQFGVD